MNKLLGGPWPAPCERCGGYSRVMAFCLECGRRYHEACFDSHKCNWEAEVADEREAG